MEREARLYELESRLNSHEARCEERDKTIFNDLAELKDEINELRALLTKLGILLTSGVAGTLVTVLMRG